MCNPNNYYNLKPKRVNSQDVNRSKQTPQLHPDIKLKKILIYCNTPHCLERKEIKWNGKFIDKWYCKKHKVKNGDRS